MLTKFFDCHLDDGHPVVRVMVEAPADAAEVLAVLAEPHLQSVAAAGEQETAAESVKRAASHEADRIALLAKLFDAEQKTWLEQHADAKPDDFKAAWPAVYAQSRFAERFGQADAKQEYFRLYALKRSCAVFTAIEVGSAVGESPIAPEPSAEHPNWTRLRKQIKTFGTERKAGDRAALLSAAAALNPPAAAAAPPKKS